MDDICSKNITSMTTACQSKSNGTFDPEKYDFFVCLLSTYASFSIMQ